MHRNAGPLVSSFPAIELRAALTRNIEGRETLLRLCVYTK